MFPNFCSVLSFFPPCSSILSTVVILTKRYYPRFRWWIDVSTSFLCSSCLGVFRFSSSGGNLQESRWCKRMETRSGSEKMGFLFDSMTRRNRHAREGSRNRKRHGSPVNETEQKLFFVRKIHASSREATLASFRERDARGTWALYSPLYPKLIPSSSSSSSSS